MSGLCASFDRADGRADLSLLRVAAAAAAERGRDGIAYWTRDSVGLAHLALRATPEAANETQPTISDDRRICLTADARIDHRHALAAELREAGTLRAAHPTDAQLILAAYERWVEECPAYLEGDFAFVLWDARKRQLFCARDPRGVRDLHYLSLGDRLWLASDPAQLLGLPGAPRSVDPWWVADYLVDLAIEPQRTPFSGIERLPPGHRLIATRDDLRIGPTPSPGGRPGRSALPEPGELDDPPAGDERPAGDPFEAACRTLLRSPSPVVGVALDPAPGVDRLVATVARMAEQGELELELLGLSHRPQPSSPGATGGSASIEFVHLPDPTVGVGVLDRPSIDRPVCGRQAAERTLMRSLADRGGAVLLTAQGATAPANPANAGVPDWLGRDLAAAAEIDHRLRASAEIGPRILNSYPPALATDSVDRALAWQQRVGIECGIEVRHPWLDRGIAAGERLPRVADGPSAAITAKALVAARESLAGELRICASGLCGLSGVEAALRSAERSTAANRAALWRALALEHWLREHDLRVDL